MLELEGLTCTASAPADLTKFAVSCAAVLRLLLSSLPRRANKSLAVVSSTGSTSVSVQSVSCLAIENRRQAAKLLMTALGKTRVTYAGHQAEYILQGRTTSLTR